MRRTKEFWSRLNKQERSYLVYIERNANKGTCMGGYLPDDCSECNVCGNAQLGSGTCMHCLNDWNELIKKGEGK